MTSKNFAQAFVSFLGDCPDPAVVEDVLAALQQALARGSPTHGPLLACLRAHGGARLFTSLLQREQEPLRLAGLQLMVAFFQQQQQQGGGGGGSSAAGDQDLAEASGTG